MSEERTLEPSARPLVLVTGAGGRVGRLTVRALAGRYRLRLVDLGRPGTPVALRPASTANWSG